MKNLPLPRSHSPCCPQPAATTSWSQDHPGIFSPPHTGQFDIRALLPASQQVTRASILLRFADDIEADFQHRVTHAYSDTGNRPETQHSGHRRCHHLQYATTHVEMLPSVVTKHNRLDTGKP